MRLAITGAPGTGKTHEADRVSALHGIHAHHTDDLIHLGWSPASEAASGWFDMQGPLIVEGVAVPRALRKWLERNPTGKPVDELLVLTKQWRPLVKPGQRKMAADIESLLFKIVPALERRGVRVARR